MSIYINDYFFYGDKCIDNAVSAANNVRTCILRLYKGK